MPIDKSIFPPLESSDSDGFLAWSKHIDPLITLQAYSQGIFPWPQEENEVLWFSPLQRGVLEFSQYRCPNSFLKWKRRNQDHFKLSINKSFPQVIGNCQTLRRKSQTGTWITNQMKHNYVELFKMGHVTSVEVWREEQLVGGIYGIMLPNYFSAESMFHLESNTGKLAFDFLVEHLKSLSHTWVDVQMLTDFTKSIGATYISREEFIKKISE